MTRALISRHRLAALALAATLAASSVWAGPPPTLKSAELTVGNRGALAAEGCNRALHLRVTEWALHEELEGQAAPAGRHWLTLAVEVENIMPADLIFDIGYPEAVLIGSFERQGYLLVNGDTVVRRAHLGQAAIDDELVLPHNGAVVAGELTYAIPETGLESLSLHYYHDQYAPLTVPLLGKAEQPQALRQAAQDVDGHDLLSLGVHEFGLHSAWLGESAPEGMQWLVVDVRGQGEWRTSVDLLALDRDANPQEQDRLRRVMEYIEAPGLLQAVVDGRHAYVRELLLSSLEDNPALLPDAWAGGQAVFPVPKDAQSLELVAYMPQFRGTDISSDIRPALRFLLQEGNSVPIESEPVAVIEDAPIRVTLHALEHVDDFAGHTTEGDERLALIEASMSNLSGVGGMMTAADRFRLQEPAGELVAVYQRGPLVLEEPFWLPADDEPRHFKLLYRFESPAETYEFEYGGVSVIERVRLPVEP